MDFSLYEIITTFGTQKLKNMVSKRYFSCLTVSISMVLAMLPALLPAQEIVVGNYTFKDGGEYQGAKALRLIPTVTSMRGIMRRGSVRVTASTRSAMESAMRVIGFRTSSTGAAYSISRTTTDMRASGIATTSMMKARCPISTAINT